MKSNRDSIAYSPHHGWIMVPMFAAAIFFTITNITAPTTRMSMLHVYTTNSTPSMDNVNANLGLYGYCSYEAVPGYNNSTEEVSYCSSTGVGYDPAYVLKYAMFDPTDIVSAADAAHYRGLSKALLVHGIAAGVAWCACAATVAAALRWKGLRTWAEPLLIAATFVLTVVCFGVDTALFVPLRSAMAPYSMSTVLGAGYWLVVTALVLVTATTLYSAFAFYTARRSVRSPAYRQVENTPMLHAMALDTHQHV